MTLHFWGLVLRSPSFEFVRYSPLKSSCRNFGTSCAAFFIVEAKATWDLPGAKQTIPTLWVALHPSSFVALPAQIRSNHAVGRRLGVALHPGRDGLCLQVRLRETGDQCRRRLLFFPGLSFWWCQRRHSTSRTSRTGCPAIRGSDHRRRAAAPPTIAEICAERHRPAEIGPREDARRDRKSVV